MTLLPSVAKYLQVEESRFRAPVSESMIQKFGETANYLLDHYPIPPGAIVDYAGTEFTIPTGWFPCDGRAISRTTYSNLFAAIGTGFGIGDGATTFNIPDLRGLFTRMVDKTALGQAGRDPDHAARVPAGTGTTEDPGSVQQDQVIGHNHMWGGTGGAGAITEVFVSPADSFTSYQYNTSDFGGSETRPKNIYMFKMIKW